MAGVCLDTITSDAEVEASHPPIFYLFLIQMAAFWNWRNGSAAKSPWFPAPTLGDLQLPIMPAPRVLTCGIFPIQRYKKIHTSAEGKTNILKVTYTV